MALYLCRDERGAGAPPLRAPCTAPEETLDRMQMSPGALGWVGKLSTLDSRPDAPSLTHLSRTQPLEPG
jgi:hypothetical protein